MRNPPCNREKHGQSKNLLRRSSSKRRQSSRTNPSFQDGEEPTWWNRRNRERLCADRRSPPATLPYVIPRVAPRLARGLGTLRDKQSFDAASHAHGDLCESVADSPRNKGHSLLSTHWLLCRASVMQQGLFCGPQHHIISYDNEFTVKWRRGFDWKKRS